MIGRKKEIERIERLLTSNRSEFLAITGRRRVGKTFLVDTVLGAYYCFSMTGIKDAPMEAQLINFGVKLSEYDGTLIPQPQKNWQMAFLNLKNYLKTLDKTQKHVIFFDELPWIATPKSDFIQFFAHFWNDYVSKQSHFILVICGSSTSWISQKIINDPGGLHNRVTENIHLYAFTLAETDAFLKDRGLQFTHQDLAKIYMSFGGIPYYLENIRRGESFSTAVERICFTPGGILHNEYANLFQALFKNAEVHQQIVATLATRHNGMTHAEILKLMGMKQPSGTYQRAMNELIVSDFVVENTPMGKKKRGSTYKLTDEFCVFYHRFIKNNKKYTPGIWQQLAESQAYKIWTGLAFETLCQKHVEAIKRALGISGVFTEVYILNVPSSDELGGFQIDLLLDRRDNTINLCEIKFHNGAFAITKEYYQQLIEKRQRFIAFSGTTKTVFITLITNHGLAPNAYSKEIIDSEVRLEQLFEAR